ncbi:uncharacterized protein FOMMEDRAFT_169024 [Fomitiporia mediterranea MF3/22]|uniref:uncharacterized protein n=1 Tax=Fomitiporia mediterranea (strain MF3/22) TaxID=694068 RepID=UPI0004407910|nr:uncharacterized protein FOMMEDRAFT_169024 [Fomitiporia mediterranea MF3/22]EJD00768.1 hypothetical protein FOMMEDRAFT_169024 [Fomitiporia mediterranea MF3/22]
MVTHEDRRRVEPRRLTTAQNKPPSFETGRDVHSFFRSNRHAIPIDALKALRNQLTIKPSESVISTQDARLTLLKEWLELSSGAQDVFAVLEKGTQPAVMAVCLSLLASVLTLTSQHFIYQPLGQPIVKILLSSQWLRKINSYLSGSQTELCLTSLKLLNAMSSFAGGRDQKGLLEAFNWDIKNFHKLLYMRRRKEKDPGYDILAKPDIRTLTLQFILSFISSASPIKAAFLEQHRDIFLSLFKGLDADPYPVIQFTLELLWTKLWQDQKIKRTLKVGLFGEKTIQQLIKLYERSEQEGSNAGQVPADVVHHFLLAICTHRGIGVCFNDNGWYPRKENEGDTLQKKEKIYNKILANVLKMLKISEDARQQELALKICRACPELVSGYLPSISISLEPRLSSKWLANMAFFGAIVSLPVPLESFYLPNGIAGSSSTPAQCAYRPTPPPLSTVVDNVIPSTSLKAYLSRGLQSSHPLVQHSAGLALVQSLTKLDSVRRAFRLVEKALEEDEIDGQWCRRRKEVEREVRKRIPEISVVIAFSNAWKGVEQQTIKSAMLSELSERLLWLYHLCMPSLVTEARYDIAKSLQSLLDVETPDAQISSEIGGLNRLRQLHVLRMLTESDLFVWHAKSVPSASSNLFILLDLYLKSKHSTIREAVLTLLTRSLGDSLLFQHDLEELHTWLNALPTNVRPAGVETPDGAPLKDERDCVVSFLDSCMQRCAKTPHRYIDEMSTFATPDAAQPLNASPLLITVIEQFNSRIRSKTFEPSDALALTTFLRKVIVGLLGKQFDLAPLQNIAKGFMESVNGGDVLVEFPVVSSALQKECVILDNCFAWCNSTLQAKSLVSEPTASQAVNDFVSQIEKLQDSRTESAESQAYELVDWIRLVDQTVSPAIVERVASVVRRLHPPALYIFPLHLSPGSGLLWSLPDDDVSRWVPTDWLLMHTTEELLSTPRILNLLRVTLDRERRTRYDYICLIGLLMHRLRVQHAQANLVPALHAFKVLLLHAKRDVTLTEFNALKEFVWVAKPELKLLACHENLSDSVITAIQQVADVTLNATSESDRSLVSHICKHWTARILDALRQDSLQQLTVSLIWIPFMSLDDRLALIEQLLPSGPQRVIGNDNRLSSVDALLSSLVDNDDSNLSVWLNDHLAAFIAFWDALPSNKVLGRIISRSVNHSIPLGCDSLDVATEGTMLKSAVNTANAHWAARLLTPSEAVSVDKLLRGTEWSADVSSIVASLIYRTSYARRSFWSWLSSGDPSQKPLLIQLAPAIHAFLDSSSDADLSDAAKDPFFTLLFKALAKEFCRNPASNRVVYLFTSCLARMIRCSLPRDDLVRILSKQLSNMPSTVLHLESLRLVHLIHTYDEDGITLVEAVLEHALQLAVRHLSESTDTPSINIPSLEAITDLVRLGKGVAQHYAEPVIAAAIRHHLCHAQCMFLAEALCANISIKPVNVNRHLQSILQNPQFDNVAASDIGCEERDALTRLLSTLFFKHPVNTCQPSHVEPLIRLYTGSLSPEDRRLVSIFQLFEEQRKTSAASIMCRWAQTGSTDQQTSLDAVLGLEAVRVFRTCLSFPNRRSLSRTNGDEVVMSSAEDRLVYDPIFLLLLFAQVMAERPPQSALSWVSLFRTNIACLVVRCLSSVDHAVRRIAMAQLGILYELMQTADMQEREHILHVLDILRDQLRSPSDQSDENVFYLPSYITLVLAHSIRGIFYPSNFIYPITARFLLQRPELDVKDVPMLYSMLYSSGDDWKKERTWMVRFISDGMLSGEDWRLLKRRHTWDLLASMFQGAHDDRSLRHSILDVLANLTCYMQATSSLILRSSLVQWIEMHVITSRPDESTAWVKIIENILVVADSTHIEQVTMGEWQLSLFRCLAHLVNDADVVLLRLITRAMARVTTEGLSHYPGTSYALESALTSLQKFEDSDDVSLPTGSGYRGSSRQVGLLPHRSFGLHQPIFQSDIETWGKTVESLWSMSLRHDIRGPVWDQLSSRILLWRAIAGERETPVGEWARRQSVDCLSSATHSA